MINVTKTYLPNIKKYQAYVETIFKNGWITNGGQLVQTLEKRLSEYLGVKNLVLVTNGTLALHIAFKLLNLKENVITTPFSLVARTSSLSWEGLNPVFIDIDEQTLNIDYNKIEQNITDTTSGIVPVHVFGNGCDVERIDEIAEKHGLKVIYDAAHAFGVKYKDNSILNYGNISILSFHATKVFHTIEGGALIIKDDELYKRAKQIINFGITETGSIENIGINAKMSEFQAAMGLCVLDDIEKILENRKKVYQYYYRELSECDKSKLRTQERNKNCTASYGYFPIILKNERNLIKIEKALNKSGINPRRYFYPSLDTLCYVDSSQSSPISNSISKRILCLPMYCSLNSDDQARIVQIVKEILK